MSFSIISSNVAIGNASVTTHCLQSGEDGVLTIGSAGGATGVVKFNGTVVSTGLTAGRVLVANANSYIVSSAVTSSELACLSGVTSAVQSQLDSKQITGAASTISTSNLPASKAVVSDASGKVAAATVSAVELGYLSGVTSGVQSQLDSKQITGAASTIATSNLSASRALVSDAGGKVAAATVSAVELGYLSGVTSPVQSQLDSKSASVITGAASTIATSNLSASRALVSDAGGKVAAATVTAAELGYLSGVVSAVQSQIDAKQGILTGATSALTSTNVTASKAVVSDASGKIVAASTTAVEIGFVAGVTSSIQAQLDTKLSSAASGGSPVGMIAYFPSLTLPTGWLSCNGNAVSRTTYASLYAVLGLAYGAGDGSTTFNLPDLRGEFIRCLDAGRGVDTGRALATLQAEDIKAHTHSTSLNTASLPGTSGGGTYALMQAQSGSTVSKVSASTGGTETRPRNVAMVACICAV